jgi:ribosomal protein L15
VATADGANTCIRLIRAGKEAPVCWGASARMTWCTRVLGALKVTRGPGNSAGAGHFGAHHHKSDADEGGRLNLPWLGLIYIML